MSSAMPCGRFSTMSTMTTSAQSRRATSCATVRPTIPAPMTVTFLRNPGPQLLDDCVCDLARSDCARIVSARLHVVGDALALANHLGDRLLEAVRGIVFLQVPQHQHAGE